MSRLENHESYLICPGKPPVRLDGNNYPVSSRLHIVLHTIWHRLPPIASVDKTSAYLPLATPAPPSSPPHTRMLPLSSHYHRQQPPPPTPQPKAQLKPSGLLPVGSHRSYHNNHHYRHEHQHHYHGRNRTGQGAPGATALITPLMGQGNHSSAAGPTGTTFANRTANGYGRLLLRNDYRAATIPVVASSSRLPWQRSATNANTTLTTTTAAATYKRTNTTAHYHRPLVRMDHRNSKPNQPVHRSRLIHILNHHRSTVACSCWEELDCEEETPAGTSSHSSGSDSGGVEYFIDIFHWVREHGPPSQQQQQQSLSLGRQRVLGSITASQHQQTQPHRSRRAHRHSNY